MEKSAEHDMSGGKTTVACTRAIFVVGMQCIPTIQHCVTMDSPLTKNFTSCCHACLHRHALIRSSCFIAVFRMHNVSSFHASCALTYEPLCLDLVYQKHILPQLLSKNPNNSFTMVIKNNQVSGKKIEWKEIVVQAFSQYIEYILYLKKSVNFIVIQRNQFVNTVTSWCNTQW